MHRQHLCLTKTGLISVKTQSAKVRVTEELELYVGYLCASDEAAGLDPALAVADRQALASCGPLMPHRLQWSKERIVPQRIHSFRSLMSLVGAIVVASSSNPTNPLGQ